MKSIDSLYPGGENLSSIPQHNKLIQTLIIASEFIDTISQEHKLLLTAAIMGTQAAIMGPFKLLQSMAKEHFFGATMETLQDRATQFIAKSMQVSEEYVEIAGSALSFGLSFFIGTSGQVVKSTQSLQKVVVKKLKGKGSLPHMKGLLI